MCVTRHCSIGVLQHRFVLQLQFLRVPLVVGIKKRNEFGVCFVPRGIARATRPHIRWHVQYAHRYCGSGGVLLGKLQRVVSAHIVGNDDFSGLQCLLRNTLQGTEQGLCCIVSGDDHRY